jgi:hypothetical protein
MSRRRIGDVGDCTAFVTPGVSYRATIRKIDLLVRPSFTTKDRMGCRVERVGFAWERGKVRKR